MRASRVVASLVLLVGASLVGRCLYLRGKAALAGVLIRLAWEETLRTGRNTPPWPWADTHPVGRLVIPRIGYDEIVLEGASPRNLAFGPARMSHGAAPGEPGNLVLAGHRTSWFRPLEDVAVGDAIVLEWRDGRTGGLRRRSYRVERVRVVAPSDASLLAPTAEDALTLVTCYPFGRSARSPLRYVVRAAREVPARRPLLLGKGLPSRRPRAGPAKAECDDRRMAAESELGSGRRAQTPRALEDRLPAG